jgi:hypothetical protein
MKKLLRIALVIAVIFAGCTEKKEAKSEESEQVSLEGMWKLKSGVWDNEDGTFLRYPEDSITEGDAYIIRSKTHYTLIASAPKMDFYRGDLMTYEVDGDKMTVSTKMSNLNKDAWFKGEEWTFVLEGNIMKAKFKNNEEVWEKIE